MRKLGILALALAVFLVASPLASAVKHVDDDYYTRQTRKSWLTKLREAFTPLTVVGGELCSTYPDNSPCKDNTLCRGDQCWAECPSSVEGGCVIEVYSDPSGYDYHWEIRPGYRQSYHNGEWYCIYYCTEDCSCTDYETQSCGEGPCSSDEMLRERTCDQNCAEEQTCVEWGCGGSTDSDNDGIIDSEDNCPHEYAKTSDGCPEEETDSDNDGIIDSEDNCPHEYAKTSDGCPACQPRAEKRCHDNDVYWYDSCGERSGKYSECGSSSGGKWTEYCQGDTLMKRRSYTDRGCSSGSCFERTTTQNRRVMVCDSCSNGACQNPGLWERFILWLKTIFYS